MQEPQVASISVPVPHAAQIARLLERCARHEDERAHGRVTFPLIVITELAMEAHHWARYLETALPPTERTGPASPHPAGTASTQPGDGGPSAKHSGTWRKIRARAR
jgi:hypothetical protein